MILKRIVEFAEAHATELPTGFQYRVVHKVIDLRSDGTLRSVRQLSGDKSGSREGLRRAEPQETPRRAGDRIVGRPFADNSEYVLGMVGEGREQAKVNKRHEAWASASRSAASELRGTFEAASLWIDNGGPASLRSSGQVEDGEELTISVDGAYLTEHPAFRAYWANQGKAASSGQCLITGFEGPVTDRMPSPIKGIPNGQMSGTALVSVNNKAGESYGLEAALNSPISPDAAEKLCNGLNCLVNDHTLVKDDRGNDRRKYKYALRVGPMVYLAWSKREQVDGFWEILENPDPEHVQQLIAQPITGKAPPPVSEADFFVMALSANAARIIVRDHHETTLAKVQKRIGEWYQRLALEDVPPVGIYRLASSLYRDASKDMPAHVPADLIRCALVGAPLPNYLLGLAVKRNLAMQGPFALTKAKTKTLAKSRLALIKAALTPNLEEDNLMELNKEHPNPAYHCGRMLSVLESIQRLAIPGLNATLVDRNYGAACASPASIFGNLLKDATSAHLPKLRKNRTGAFYALEQRLQEVAVAIGDEFPKTLPLKDQGLFALGYYHQRAWDLSEARKNKELKDLAEAAATTEEER